MGACGENILERVFSGSFGSADGVFSDGENTRWNHDFRGSADSTRAVGYRILHNPLGERFKQTDRLFTAGVQVTF